MSGAKQLDLVIDESGEPFYSGSTPLLRHLGGVSPDIDLTEYVVRNMGFIRLRQQDGRVRLTLRPGKPEYSTIEGVTRLLLAQSWQRVAIERIDDLRTPEVFFDIEEVAARLKDLGAPSAHQISPSGFFNQELSLDRLKQSGHPSLGIMLRQWRRAKPATLTPDHILARVPAYLQPRVTLTRIVGPTKASRSRVVVEHIGAGIQVFDPTWAQNVIGRDLEEQPDPIYGERSARAYHEVAELGQPRLERVDAVIDVPGRPVRRSRYDRLMLPWVSRGEVFVCGASVLRTSYSLEPVAAATQAVRS
jgi:hypothetical protein